MISLRALIPVVCIEVLPENIARSQRRAGKSGYLPPQTGELADIAEMLIQDIKSQLATFLQLLRQRGAGEQNLNPQLYGIQVYSLGHMGT